MKQTEIRKYKCMVVVRPTLSSDKVMELIKGMLDIVDKTETVDIQSNVMHTLAYSMDRNKQGHMVTIDMKIMPKTLNVIRRRMEIDENVLRVMFVKDDIEQGTSKRTFQIKDDFVKSMSTHTTKRGKINFGRNLPRAERSFISQSIKRLRFMGILPYCNYDA